MISSLDSFVRWLADTRWSIALHESRYMYLVVESVHVLTLTGFVGLSAMLDLRLMGLTMRDVPVSQITRRIVPWMAVGFVVMAASGSLLFYAIPVRSYHSVWFRLKMAMMLFAGLNAWIFHEKEHRRVAEWDLDPVPPRAARIAGAASLILWILIIFSGRFIAYNWFDCDRPQSATIKALAGCTDASAQNSP
jgi:hypothetical protein